MAGIYHQAGCCCSAASCADAVCLTDQQSNPLVVISGDCQCAGTVGGPYEFAGYVPYDPQAWVWYGGWCEWQDGTDFNLNISCYHDDHWHVWIGPYGGAGDLVFDGRVSAKDLFCGEDGKFAGTFTIPGQDRCQGLTATITF